MTAGSCRFRGKGFGKIGGGGWVSAFFEKGKCEGKELLSLTQSNKLANYNRGQICATEGKVEGSEGGRITLASSTVVPTPRLTSTTAAVWITASAPSKAASYDPVEIRKDGRADQWARE